MRSRLARILYFAALKPLSSVVLLTLAAMGGLANAQAGEAWQIDSNQSFAHLSLGVGSNALEVGVARVSGLTNIDSESPADPAISFEIRPESEIGAEHAIISFRSGSATKRDGQLVLEGKLTVARIERSVATEPDEAYYGPRYGNAVVYTVTRQVAFVLSDNAQRPTRKGELELSGTASVRQGDFPQLLDAITLDDWPTQLVNGEKCMAPSTIREDYHGINCTGSVVASLRNAEVPTGASSGEGFYGFAPTVTPDQDWSSIVLNLTAERIASMPSAATNK